MYIRKKNKAADKARIKLLFSKNRTQIKLKTAVEIITEFLGSTESLTNKALIEICRSNGIESISGRNEAHFIHEILETAVNLHVVKQFRRSNLLEKESEKNTLACLTKLLEKLPPQSWRGEKQTRFQQFSTPPTVAYLMAKILNPSSKELILEPSAGTGALAAWLQVAGCRVHVNELSEARRTLLELQGYTPTAYDAEFIDDLLPEEIKPEKVLMNPPFSSSGGKTKNNGSNYGFRHVRAALSRLETQRQIDCFIGNGFGD